MTTLADKYRPKSLRDMVGQPKLLGPDGMLTRIMENQDCPSLIFYGPPGCGKTTAGKILQKTVLQKHSDYMQASLNATNASLTDIKNLIKQAEGRTIVLYLDEIQYFNKKQQQSLLPYVESGNIILIAATTDNPYYCCYDALISRCFIMEFTPVAVPDMIQRLNTIAAIEQITLTPEAATLIAENAAGDVRRAITLLDLAHIQYPAQTLTKDCIKDILPSTRMSGFDTDGDTHFALISALQKSIRGSDPNAAVFYLAKLLESGDLLSPCRRLMVIAHEDIGLGNPNAIPFTYACIEMAKQLGLPEANKPLTNAVLYLAISPKASTCENTYNRACADVKRGCGTVIPPHLRHACSEGYLYPHDYPNHWVRQQYLPDDLVNHAYYIPEQNAFEQAMLQHWSGIMK